MLGGASQARERYTILGAIHRGGMGEILLARAEGADGFSRKVVLKGLLPALDDDDASLEMFRREARIMARLEHPNVVRVLDFTYVHDKPYLAMEYVRGRNLHQVIQRALAYGGLPPAVVFHVLAQALRGLHSAHTARDEDGSRLGAIHRDVSPGNILLSFFGEVKVTDFGIAKAEGSRSLTGPRAIRGKARYAPPEVIRGEAATPRGDVFAAGVVLAEALTGEPLWDQRTVSDTLIKIVSEPRDETVDRVASRVPTIRGLRAVLRKSLALYADDRFPTALAFAEALEALSRTVGGPLTQAELGTYLQALFADAPDLPREDGPSLPPQAASPAPPPPAEDRDDDHDDDQARAQPADRGGADPRDDAPARAHANSDLDERSDGGLGAEVSGDTMALLPSDTGPRDTTTRDIARTPRATPVPLEPALLPVPPLSAGPITATLRPPHWSRRPAPVLDTPLRPLRLIQPAARPESDDAAYFSELIMVPSQTEQHSSGPIDAPPVDEHPLETLSRWRWRLTLQRRWVLVSFGMLLGAGTAILGTILATLGD